MPGGAPKPLEPAPLPSAGPRIRVMEGQVPAEKLAPPLPQGGAPQQPEVKVSIDEEPAGGRNVLRTVLVATLALIIAGGIGALGYFVVFPLLFPAEAPSSADTTPLPAETPPSSGITHQSFFVRPPASRARINFLDLSRDNIRNALQQTALSPVPAGSLKELELLDSGDSQILASEFLRVFLSLTPEEAAEIAQVIDSDFTAYLFYTTEGAWPGYIFRVTDPEQARATLGAEVERTASRFYLSSPGILGPFQSANYNNTNNRYAVGSQPNVSFNYGIMGDFMVISTTFDGYKAALESLRL